MAELGPRVVLEDVLSPETCRALVSLARSVAVRGYRPGVASATCFEVAAAAPHSLPLLMRARDVVRDAVEAALGLPLGLLVEFTGLISWRQGAELGWHHDANNSYLQQRSHSAVCYLSSAGQDFTGGAFRFQSGEPTQVLAAPGRVVAYNAGEVHSVTPVSSGERFALTLWFTLDPSHNEDSKLLERLRDAGPPQGLPDSMYALPPDGTDLRLCRMAMMGFALEGGGSLLRAPLEGGTAAAAAQQAAGLQLVVHPTMHAWWLGGGSHSGSKQPCWVAGEQAEVVDTGLRFDSVLQAAHFVFYWAERSVPSSRFSREEVCSWHLCTGCEGPTCGWLGGSPRGSTHKLAPAPDGSSTAALVQSLAAAAPKHREHDAQLQRQYAETREAWLRVGGVF